MDNVRTVSEKIYSILKGNGLPTSMFDDAGNPVIKPGEATRFVVASPNMIVRHDVTTNKITLLAKKNDKVEDLRTSLHNLTKKYLYNFEFGLLSKRLKPKPEENNSNSDNKGEPVTEGNNAALPKPGETYRGGYVRKVIPAHEYRGDPRNVMKVIVNKGQGYGGRTDMRQYFIDKDGNDITEGAVMAESIGPMTGSSKTSYQPVDDVKLVVHHKKAVNEEVRGARSRNIQSIYVQRGGERFKMQTNNLAAARAMARHVAQGGEVHDTVGATINEMAEEQRTLTNFVKYVNKSGIVSEDNAAYVDMAKRNISDIKESFKRLTGVKSYAVTAENIVNRSSAEILEDDVDLDSLFTETHLDDTVSNAFPSIKKGLARQKAYESKISAAITKESFAGLTDMLTETDGIEFTSPHARLGHQVARLGDAATDSALQSHLYGISQKLNNREALGDFDYTTIKQCLMQANESVELKGSEADAIVESYTAFFNQFDVN